MDMRVGDAPGKPVDPLAAAFRADVLAGLAQPRKAIPARWFYDRRGSELFDAITRLDDYYPTRAEVAIFAEHGAALAAAIGRGRAVIEFGAGSAAKTPLLLDRVAPSAYVAIDISGDFMREACAGLAARYPGLRVEAVEADFMLPVTLPPALGGERLGFFPGSTIGNLAPGEAVDLLRAMRATLGDGALLLIGMDRVKDAAVLVRAYDDAEGLTGAFNRNLAARINRELGGTIPLDALAHRAVWNADHARIEMHLAASRDIAFAVAGARFALRAGETIHTENSHKYDDATARMLLRAGGWEPTHAWRDADARFMVLLARATAAGVTP